MQITKLFWARPKLASFLILLILSSFLFGYRTGERGVWSSHEPRAGQIARSMLQNNDFLVPKLGTGMETYQKPPLFYWSVYFFARVLGNLDELSIRLPTICSALLLVVAIFFAATHLLGLKVGFLAAFLFMVSADGWWLAHIGRIDMMLSLCVFSAGISFYVGYHAATLQHKASLYLLGYLLMGLSVLAKGPIGLVLVACGLLPHVICRKDWQELWIVGTVWLWGIAGFIVGYLSGIWGLAGFSLLTGLTLFSMWKNNYQVLAAMMPHLVGLVGFATVVLPWFVAVHLATNGGFTQEFFIQHHLSRFFGDKIAALPELSKSRPFWFYLPHLLVGSIPWTFFLLILFRKTLRQHLTKNSVPFFLLAWASCIVLFLSMSSFKRADYLLPALPLICSLVAWAIVQAYTTALDTKALQNVVLCSGGFFFVLVILAWIVEFCSIAGCPISEQAAKVVAMEWFRKKLNKTEVYNCISLLQFWESQSRWFLTIFSLGLSAGVAMIYRWRHKELLPVLMIGCLAAMCYMIHLTKILPYQEPYHTQAQLAAEIARAVPHGRIVLYETEAHGLVFYLRRPVEVFELAYPQRNLVNVLEIERGKDVFFLLPKKCYQKMQSLLPGYVQLKAQNIPGHLEGHVLLQAK